MKIDKTIDLDFIYELTSDLYCCDNGRTSIDPVLYFRIQLIGYIYGIKSGRRLCQEIHFNIAYRWFCRLHLDDKVLDHFSLSRIRDRFGVETYQKVFERLVQLLQEKGFIKGDGTIN